MLLSNHYTRKRIVIIIVYVILFSLIYLAIHYVRKPAETCFDKIQNQGESGLDCGGPCSICSTIKISNDFQVQEKAFVAGGNNKFDVIVKMNNPNGSIGASVFNYTFTLLDEAGKTIATKSAANYILPGDTRYIAELGLSTENNQVPAEVNFTVSDVQWSKLTNQEKPQFTIFNKKFGPSEVGTTGSDAAGVLRNESLYDLQTIKVISVLRDGQNAIVGVSMTQLNTVRSKEEREVHFQWPFLSGENIQSVEIDAQTNIFDPQDFI